jgi:hypothetical protein
MRGKTRSSSIASSDLLKRRLLGIADRISLQATRKGLTLGYFRAGTAAGAALATESHLWEIEGKAGIIPPELSEEEQ